MRSFVHNLKDCYVETRTDFSLCAQKAESGPVGKQQGSRILAQFRKNFLIFILFNNERSCPKFTENGKKSYLNAVLALFIKFTDVEIEVWQD
jgi:hypothetical protein